MGIILQVMKLKTWPNIIFLVWYMTCKQHKHIRSRELRPFKFNIPCYQRSFYEKSVMNDCLHACTYAKIYKIYEY